MGGDAFRSKDKVSIKLVDRRFVDQGFAADYDRRAEARAIIERAPGQGVL